MKKLILVDVDETIAYGSSIAYQRAIFNTAKLICSKVPNTNFDEIFNILSTFNAKRQSKNGYSATCFQESLILAYAYIVGKFSDKKLYSCSVENEIKNYASNAVYAPVKLYSNANEAISLLREIGELCICTGGDNKIQKAKIKSFGEDFENNFSKIFVLQHKNVENYLNIKSKHPNMDIWMIGNSPRCDIVPAHKAGINTIWIKKNNVSEFDKDKVPQTYTAKDIYSAAKLLARI